MSSLLPGMSAGQAKGAPGSATHSTADPVRPAGNFAILRGGTSVSSVPGLGRCLTLHGESEEKGPPAGRGDGTSPPPSRVKGELLLLWLWLCCACEPLVDRM